MCGKCNDHKSKCDCHSPLVGAWACNFTAETPESVEVYAGNLAYAAGGTFVCDIDISNQRPFYGFPNGAHGTPITGTWKQKSKHHFKIVGTLVALTLNPTTNKWEPLARIKEVSDIELHGDRYTGTRTLTFYDYCDISLTKTLPVPQLVQTVEAKRVK